MKSEPARNFWGNIPNISHNHREKRRVEQIVLHITIQGKMFFERTCCSSCVLIHNHQRS